MDVSCPVNEAIEATVYESECNWRGGGLGVQAWAASWEPELRHITKFCCIMLHYMHYDKATASSFTTHEDITAVASLLSADRTIPGPRTALILAAWLVCEFSTMESSVAAHWRIIHPLQHLQLWYPSHFSPIITFSHLGSIFVNFFLSFLPSISAFPRSFPSSLWVMAQHSKAAGWCGDDQRSQTIFGILVCAVKPLETDCVVCVCVCVVVEWQKKAGLI